MPQTSTPHTIGFLITRFSEFGGAQIHVRDLASEALKRGNKVVLITGSLGPASREAEALGVRVIHAPLLVREISPMKDLKAVGSIAGILRGEKIHLLHCHSSKAGIIGRLAAKRAKVPCVFTAHGWAFTEGVSPKKRKLYSTIEKIMAPLSRKIITVSEYDRNLALAFGVGSEDRLVAVQNGMPYLPAPVRTQRRQEDPIRLIMVARIATPKDQAQLISGLARIKSENWTLSIVGSGEDEHLRKMASDLGLENKIDFLGERSDVPDLLESHDVFCLISNWEGFPLTIIEAMRASMPVIASDVGGCSEAVQDGVTGLSVPRQDPGAIARAVKRYIERPDLIAAHGAAGRESFEGAFTFDHMADKTFAIYHEILK